MKSNTKLPFESAYRLRLALFVVFVLALFLAGNFWVFRSTQIRQEFQSYILKGKWNEAGKMISGQSSMSPTETLISFTGNDGSMVSIPKANMNIQVLEESSRPLRHGIADYLRCREHFQFIAFWKEETGRQRAAAIYFTITVASVRIHRIEVYP